MFFAKVFNENTIVFPNDKGETFIFIRRINIK